MKEFTRKEVSTFDGKDGRQVDIYHRDKNGRLPRAYGAYLGHFLMAGDIA